MGKTNEFTLVADADFTGKQGCAVVVKNELVNRTPVGTLAGAGVAIDGIVTDITAGAPQVLAVAKVGDIVFAKLAGTVTVADELQVGDNGALIKKNSGVAVAKALASGANGELIPVIIK